jgi:hypothetical protein
VPEKTNRANIKPNRPNTKRRAGSPGRSGDRLAPNLIRLGFMMDPAQKHTESTQRKLYTSNSVKTPKSTSKEKLGSRFERVRKKILLSKRRTEPNFRFRFGDFLKVNLNLAFSSVQFRFEPIVQTGLCQH